MISLKNSPNAERIAVIRSDSEEEMMSNKMVYVTDDPIGKGKKSLLLDIDIDDGEFIIFPRKKPERVYIVGPNGSGKSWQAGKYCESYNIAYPKSKIVMFTPHEKDEAYKNVQNLIIMDLNDESLFDEPLDITKLSSCLVIFDDTDNHQVKKSKLWLDNLEKDLIMNGRKYGIYVLSIAHMMMNGASTRHKIAEASRTIFFPHSGSVYHITRYLTIYAGLNKEMVKTVLNLRSRWVCISNTYPQYILYDRGIFLIK